MRGECIMSSEMPEGYSLINHIIDAVGEKVVTVTFSDPDDNSVEYKLGYRAEILSAPYLDTHDEWYLDAKVISRCMIYPETATMTDTRMKKVNEILEEDDNREALEDAVIEALAPPMVHLPIEGYYGRIALSSILGPEGGAVFTVR